MYEEIPEVYGSLSGLLCPGHRFDFLPLPPRIPDDEEEPHPNDRYEDADDLSMSPFLNH